MQKVATGCAPGKARERSYKYRSDTVPQKRPEKYWLQLQHLLHPYGSRGSGADRAPHSDRRKIQGKTAEPYCCRWPAGVRKTGYKKYTGTYTVIDGTNNLDVKLIASTAGS